MTLTFNDYQTQAAKTAGAGGDNALVRIDLAIHGMAEEWGEFAQHLTHFIEHGAFAYPDEALKEAGDCLWYPADICTATGYSLSMCVSGHPETPISSFQYSEIGRNDNNLTLALAKIPAALAVGHGKIKKHIGHEQPLEYDEFIPAMVRGYVGWLRVVMNIVQFDLSSAAYENLIKLENRHPNGFSPAYHGTLY